MASEPPLHIHTQRCWNSKGGLHLPQCNLELKVKFLEIMLEWKSKDESYSYNFKIWKSKQKLQSSHWHRVRNEKANVRPLVLVIVRRSSLWKGKFRVVFEMFQVEQGRRWQGKHRLLEGFVLAKLSLVILNASLLLMFQRLQCVFICGLAIL